MSATLCPEMTFITQTKMKKFLKRAAITIAALLFWILIWYFAAEKAGTELILPSPFRVFARLWELAKTLNFYAVLGQSFLRIFFGFLAGILLGFALGTLSFYIKPFHALVSPVMAVVRATPVASFILVVLFWMTTDRVPSFISLLMVLPIVWQNTVLGYEKKDPLLDEMAKAFRLSPFRTFLKIDLPQVLSFTLSAGKTALGLAWKAGVAAEVLALTKNSVGLMIYNAKMYLETVDLYAWTCAIILFSMGLEKLFTLLFAERRKQYADRA